jgi:hypothetical protein
MAAQAVLLSSATFSVPKPALVTNYSKFLDDPDVLKSLYRIGSAISVDSVKMFLAALDGTAPELTTENLNDLFLLSEESRFAAFLSQISDFWSQHAVVDDESGSAFDALKSTTSSKIEHFVSCRRKFRICGSRIFVWQATTACLGRRTKRSKALPVYYKRKWRIYEKRMRGRLSH